LRFEIGRIDLDGGGCTLEEVDGSVEAILEREVVEIGNVELVDFETGLGRVSCVKGCVRHFQ
jgi:hypothetical protein